jgi:hypothetical protein
MSMMRSAVKSIALRIPPVRHLYRELVALRAENANLHTALKKEQRVAPGQLRDAMVKTTPSPQNDIDIFAGEWLGAVPIPGVISGQSLLFDANKDERVPWVNNAFGALKGMNVLELGPYEGGHTYQLDRVFGAAAITAVESNPRAFLRCLIVKNLFAMNNSHFLLGDFSKYLAEGDKEYDLIFASGVLYHMTEPFELLKAIAKRTKRVFLWTHYYDEEAISRNTNLDFRFEPSRYRKTTFDGHSFNEYCFIYRDGTQPTDHLGGTQEYAYWLELPDILTILRQLGFTRIETRATRTDHPFGPHSCFIAEK